MKYKIFFRNEQSEFASDFGGIEKTFYLLTKYEP